MQKETSHDWMPEDQGWSIHAMLPSRTAEPRGEKPDSWLDWLKRKQEEGLRLRRFRESDPDMQWAGANVDEATLEDLISNYLSELPEQTLCQIIRQQRRLRCGLPISIWRTYHLRLESVVVIERGQRTLMDVVYRTATEVEADIDSVNGCPRESKTMSFDLETSTTVRLTVDEVGDVDMSLREVQF